MKDNFDLRKFLTESKLKKESTKSLLKEDFIELTVLSEPIDALIRGFMEWYEETEFNWSDFEDSMEEGNVDQAAKSAQMEILTYLNQQMNKKIQLKENEVVLHLQ